jgi:hypothetical protein
MDIFERKIFLLDGFLSDEECNNYCTIIDGRDDKQKRIFATETNFYNEACDDPQTTKKFLERIAKYNIPFATTVSISNYVTIAKFQQGEDFGIHTDTGIIDHDNHLETSHVLLIYLNDNFEGGHTKFFHDGSAGTPFTLLADIVPKKGMALIFDIDMWHCADKVTSNIKYWIGSDLMSKYPREKN